MDVIHPPHDVRSVIRLTAKFVARQGLQFESKLLQESSATQNRQKFAFLSPDHVFNPYYNVVRCSWRKQFGLPPEHARPSMAVHDEPSRPSMAVQNEPIDIRSCAGASRRASKRGSLDDAQPVPRRLVQDEPSRPSVAVQDEPTDVRSCAGTSRRAIKRTPLDDAQPVPRRLVARVWQAPRAEAEAEPVPRGSVARAWLAPCAEAQPVPLGSMARASQAPLKSLTDFKRYFKEKQQC